MMVDQIEKAEVAETKRCRWSIRGISGKLRGQVGVSRAHAAAWCSPRGLRRHRKVAREQHRTVSC